MPESPVPIHLGDLAQALKKLKPADEKTRLAIAMTLGMSWETSEQLKPVKKLKRALPVNKPVTIRSQPSFDPVATSRAVLASSIEHTRVEDAAASIYVPPLPASAPEDETQSPPLEPLFFPRWTRNILTASLATASEIGPLDVDRIAELEPDHRRRLLQPRASRRVRTPQHAVRTGGRSQRDDRGAAKGHDNRRGAPYAGPRDQHPAFVIPLATGSTMCSISTVCVFAY